MTFIWPVMLISLFLVPLLVALYLLLQKRRRQMAERFSKMGFGPGSAARSAGVRRHVPPLLFLASLTILLVAMARPQATVSLPREQGTVILAFDVSGSMAATDIQPTRMEAAKTAARDFVQRLPPTVNVGVVAFSDNGFAVQTPTNDPQEIQQAINRLAPQRGTSVGNGILASLNAISVDNGQHVNLYSNLSPTPQATPTPMPKGTYTNAIIVMLTDGENNESPNVMTSAQAAADQGVRIYTVGIGSPTGTTLHINGFNVFTKLDEATLQQISQLTGGTYYNAQSAQDLLNIYQNLDTQLVIKPEKTEVTSLFAGASILVFLMGGVFSLLWFSRFP
jgi:Ca-activated chloride channel family protein